jgi:hypothetical protein
LPICKANQQKALNGSKIQKAWMPGKSWLEISPGQPKSVKIPQLGIVNHKFLTNLMK